jgi:hypothetical protein
MLLQRRFLVVDVVSVTGSIDDETTAFISCKYSFNLPGYKYR